MNKPNQLRGGRPAFNYNLGTQLQAIIDDRDTQYISAFGLHSGQKVLLVGKLATATRVVYLCDDYFAASQIYDELKYISNSVAYLPSIDDVLVARTYNNVTSQQRLQALKQIVNGDAQIIVTTVAAALQPCVSSQTFKQQLTTLTAGKEHGIDALCSKWIDCGYSRVDSVFENGQFCWRGDIVDIWGAGESVPIRLEFFGDDLESIKEFDPESRLSTKALETVTFAPNCESGDLPTLAKLIGECTLFVDDARTVADARDRVLQEHNNRISSLLLTAQISLSMTLPVSKSLIMSLVASTWQSVGVYSNAFSNSPNACSSISYFSPLACSLAAYNFARSSAIF